MTSTSDLLNEILDALFRGGILSVIVGVLAVFTAKEFPDLNYKGPRFAFMWATVWLFFVVGSQLYVFYEPYVVGFVTCFLVYLLTGDIPDWVEPPKKRKVRR